ncbi:MAG: hypothetical protein GC137_08010 [Alphaproteobacteria bacterium]|nr:hypothetical protein [Alphaproteobacteria bacterium]
MVTDPLKNREIIIEFHPVGQFMKVSVMDVETLTEVSIQGPVNASKDILQKNALKRLEYVLRKKRLIS